MPTFEELTVAIREFACERDWEQFHSPKNLAIALAVEAAELLEHFQWLSEPESDDMSDDKLEPVSQEIADVQIYLMRLADRLGVDVLSAAASKLEMNRLKYPADRVRGSAKKYTAYEEEPEG
jgi:NTP pyrophosphatase (non-canonical NTP hydrolase)